MLSSANIDFSGILIDLIAIIFFGFGSIYTLIVGMVNLVKKRSHTIGYYFLSFLISGFVALAIVALMAVIWVMSL